MVYFQGLDGKRCGGFDQGVDGRNTALDDTEGNS
jgi:hypothetical protein